MAGEPIITIVGNLTAAPKLEYTQNANKPYARFTVASTPRKRNQQTGEMVDGEAMFVRCTAWQELGEHCAESLQKGTRVIVTGRLTVSRYRNQEGVELTGLDLAVDDIGPSLRWATAQVTKAQRGGYDNGSQGYNQGYNQGRGQGRVSYDAPAGGSAYDPWADAPAGGSSFDDNPPF